MTITANDIPHVSQYSLFRKNTRTFECQFTMTTFLMSGNCALMAATTPLAMLGGPLYCIWHAPSLTVTTCTITPDVISCVAPNCCGVTRPDNGLRCTLFLHTSYSPISLPIHPLEDPSWNCCTADMYYPTSCQANPWIANRGIEGLTSTLPPKLLIAGRSISRWELIEETLALVSIASTCFTSFSLSPKAFCNFGRALCADPSNWQSA